MKRIPITPDIQSKIDAAVGAGTDTSGFAVFESIAANTRPFTGFKDTLNEGARLTYLTLMQAANLLQAGDSVPMIWSHDRSTMPVGRVFWGEVTAEADGEAALRTLFYIDGTNADVASKIDASSIDEVSVGMATTQILCSECGWDFQGPDATFENLYARTCANDHTVGTDGVHVMRSGLDAFIELSLVTRGAANGAKIVKLADRKIGTTAQMTRLAARGFDLDKLMLCASATPEPETKKDAPVDLTQLNASLVSETVARQMADAKVTDLTTRLEAAVADATALRTERDTLKAAVPVSETAVAAATGFLTETFKSLTIASGGKVVEAEVPTDPAALVAGIKERQSALTALIPTGGKADPAGGDKTNLTARTNVRAFTGKE